MITQFDDNTWDWIEQHRDCDTTRLRLATRKNDGMSMDFAILQIECRRKAAKKLAKTLQNPRFIFPTTLSAEQCTSDRLAEFHVSLIHAGDQLLDMTSGLGIDVFHLSSKASSVTAIDIVPEIAEALAINATTLKCDNVTAINADSCEYLRNSDAHYDVIFIDPARRGDGGKRLYALSDCHPNVIELLETIRKRCNRLIIKASPMIDVSQTIKDLPYITDLYAIGTRQECKELVAVVDFNNQPSIPNLHCVTLHSDRETTFSFTQEEENEATANYCLPQEGDFIYEPYPAVMKMQPMKLITQNTNTHKIHPNTHLYISRTEIEDFPGERYKIERIYEFSSKRLKEIAKNYPKASVAVKNFILTAEELRRRLKVKESDIYRLIGVTACDGNRYILITRHA